MSCHTGPIDLYDITTAAAAAEAEILEAVGTRTNTTGQSPAKMGSAGRDANSPYPPVDIFDAPSHWTLLVAVPGVKKEEDVSVCWDDGSSALVIRGNVGTPGYEGQREMGRMVVGERKVGAFERTIQLPPPGEEEGEAVDGEKMTSKLEDGIMIVTAPKRKAGK
jgi:HSP20 family protein